MVFEMSRLSLTDKERTAYANNRTRYARRKLILKRSRTIGHCPTAADSCKTFSGADAGLTANQAEACSGVRNSR